MFMKIFVFTEGALYTGELETEVNNWVRSVQDGWKIMNISPPSFYDYRVFVTVVYVER